MTHGSLTMAIWWQHFFLVLPPGKLEKLMKNDMSILESPIAPALSLLCGIFNIPDLIKGSQEKGRRKKQSVIK